MSALNTVFHILFGAIAGFAVGILGPLAIFYLLSRDPAMRQGGAFAVAMSLFVTAPAGAFAGAIWGYQRLHPPGEIMKKGALNSLAEFEQQFGRFTLDEQRLALSRIVPEWLQNYRNAMRVRMVVAGALTLLSVGAPFALLFLVAYLWRTGRLILEMRSVLKNIREQWGDDIVESAASLPYSLR